MKVFFFQFVGSEEREGKGNAGRGEERGRREGAAHVRDALKIHGLSRHKVTHSDGGPHRECRIGSNLKRGELLFGFDSGLFIVRVQQRKE